MQALGTPGGSNAVRRMRIVGATLLEYCSALLVHGVVRF